MKKILIITGNIVLVILIIIGIMVGFSLLPVKNNYKIYFVTSGSMEPTIATGSMVVSLPQDTYNVGDVITYKNIDSTRADETTTHRIVELILDKSGNRSYITKGDANNSNDDRQLSQDRIIGRMVFSIPLIGYLIGYIKTLPGLILIVVIPATIIIFEEIKKIRNETREIMKRRRDRKKGICDKTNKKENGTVNKKNINQKN